MSKQVKEHEIYSALLALETRELTDGTSMEKRICTSRSNSRGKNAALGELIIFLLSLAWRNWPSARHYIYNRN